MNAAVREFGFTFPSEVAPSFTCVAMTDAGLMSSFIAYAAESRGHRVRAEIEHREIRLVEIVHDRFHLGVDAGIPRR